MKAISPQELPEPVELTRDGMWFRITNYFSDDPGAISAMRSVHSVEPVAQLVETGPESLSDDERCVVIRAHFHLVRQFQVFVEGDRPSIGKRPLGSFDFHYVDPSTPYGPFMAGKGGITFFTLRPRGAAPGIYYMPGSREDMTGRAGRNIVVALSERAGGEQDVPVGSLLGSHEDRLAAFRLSARPGETVSGPDPAGSGGQYHLVTQGSLIHENTEYGKLSLLWVEPEDAPAAMTAGPDGLSLLVMQFPVVNPAIESMPPAGAGMAEVR